MIRLMEWYARKKKEIRVNEHNNNNNYYMNDNIWQPKRDKNPATTQQQQQKNCWQKMENHKIDGCTSAVSSLYLPHLRRNNHFSTLECMQNLQFLPLPHTAHTHISPHTHAHSLTHSKLPTHTLPSPFQCLMPQFFGYYFNVFAHRNGETF